jgi:uncharacterized membrane-anchored protein
VVNDRRLLSRLTTPGALRVPEITVYFWVIKALSTALGESTSDYLVHVMNPVIAVGLGFVFFAGALILQFSVRRYIAWTYWLAVVMVGVFGTMAADVLHVGFGVPYTVSSILYALVLAAVFFTWSRTEHTLSIHSIDTPRREIFYWLAVVATFAMGTALGDFSAFTLHLGYLTSALVFAVVIAIPALGYRLLGWNAIFSFWFAYVATRPLGASLADYLGKPKTVGGLGLGDGPVVFVLALAIICLVAYLATTRRDVQGARRRHGAHGPGVRPAGTHIPAMDGPSRTYRGLPAGYERSYPGSWDAGYERPDPRAPADGHARSHPGVPPGGLARPHPGSSADGNARPRSGPPRDGSARPNRGAPADGYPRRDRPPAGYPRPRPDGPRPRPDDRTVDYRRPRPDDRARDYPPRRPDDRAGDYPPRQPGERPSDYPPRQPGDRTRDYRRPRPDDDPTGAYRRPR